MRIGSIDIGTNTVLLLIAEVDNSKINTIRNEFSIPRIGKDLSQLKIISDDSISKLLDIIKKYIAICTEYKVERIICAGTAPFRIANNTKQVVEKVLIETGLNIIVLSEEEEAHLTYLGGISNFTEFINTTNFVVIDIGGGSTEIIYGNFDQMYFSKSYKIGAVTLKDKLFSSFPYLISLEDSLKFLDNIFKDTFNFKNFITIAVAGTPTTIASIKLKQSKFNEIEVDKMIISKDYLVDLIEQLYFKSPKNILNEFKSVAKGREDVLLPGSIILYYLLDKFNSTEFYVSSRGIRYGLVIKELIHQMEGFWTKVGLKKFLSSLYG